MKNLKKFFFYGFISVVVFIVDQFTKSWALKNTQDNYFVNNFLSFKLCYNRGISWGLFNLESSVAFVFITFLILFVIGWLIWYAVLQARIGKSIFAETIVISGALSNVLDRIIHGGVVDFIVCSYNNWIWPTFNVADALIVCGTLFMAYKGMKE